jgi:hypothetical protein
MDNPKEIPNKTHWLVLLFAGILATADLAALCFGLAMVVPKIAANMLIVRQQASRGDEAREDGND